MNNALNLCPKCAAAKRVVGSVFLCGSGKSFKLFYTVQYQICTMILLENVLLTRERRQGGANRHVAPSWPDRAEDRLPGIGPTATTWFLVRRLLVRTCRPSFGDCQERGTSLGQRGELYKGKGWYPLWYKSMDGCSGRF